MLPLTSINESRRSKEDPTAPQPIWNILPISIASGKLGFLSDSGEESD